MKPNPKQFTSLDTETRTYLSTVEAAHHLNRAPHTLRLWSSQESGPLRPQKIAGRLAWPVAEVKRVLGLEASK